MLIKQEWCLVCTILVKPHCKVTVSFLSLCLFYLLPHTVGYGASRTTAQRTHLEQCFSLECEYKVQSEISTIVTLVSCCKRQHNYDDDNDDICTYLSYTYVHEARLIVDRNSNIVIHCATVYYTQMVHSSRDLHSLHIHNVHCHHHQAID